MIRDEARLRQLLGDPELTWLIERARRRLAGGAASGSVTLPGATPGQREAIDRLFGRRASRGDSMSLRLADVEALLQSAGICDSLAEAIEALTGPLVDMRAQRQAAEAAWAEVFAVADDPAQPWVQELRASGLLKRLARNDVEVAASLLRQASEIERRLPASGIPLAELAAAVTGDSHALDPGTPLGTIAVRLAAAIGRMETWDTTEAWRDAWTGAGVLCDELSAPVLTVNLRSDGAGLTDRALRLHAGPGEPYRLTTRQLLRDPPSFGATTAGRTVFVCENPTVVAAVAHRLGGAGAPLVCVEGQPRTAARVLLNRLTASGAHLAYHGDFDWPGIHIANLVMRRHGAVPWRFSTADYVMRRHGAVPWRFSTADYRAARGGRALDGAPVTADWDPDLTPAMVSVGRAVHEEEVLDLLLADLAAPR